ncbi:MAG: hypothetical protein Q7S92_05515 [Candidatus Diapherotrites archaeon]|nr:hypothetical protein [Candidatus Diapherotrites archaeon]
MKPRAPAGIQNIRRRKSGTKKVHVHFSFGPHLQEQTINRLRRQTRRLKKGDAYFKE